MTEVWRKSVEPFFRYSAKPFKTLPLWSHIKNDDGVITLKWRSRHQAFCQFEKIFTQSFNIIWLEIAKLKGFCLCILPTETQNLILQI